MEYQTNFLKYCSVPQICPPSSRISPPAFLAQTLAEVFYPAYEPPTPHSTPHSTPRRRLIPQSKYRDYFYLHKPLSCLPFKCLLRMRTTRINDGHASYFVEVPCFLAPQRLSSLARSVMSISPCRIWRCLTLSPHPPLTMRSWFTGTGREGIIAREIVASCV